MIEEFPDYAISNKLDVRHIKTGLNAQVVRINKFGGKMVVLVRDGKKYTRSDQALYAKTFNVELKP